MLDVPNVNFYDSSAESNRIKQQPHVDAVIVFKPNPSQKIHTGGHNSSKWLRKMSDLRKISA